MLIFVYFIVRYIIFGAIKCDINKYRISFQVNRGGKRVIGELKDLIEGGGGQMA